MAASSSPGHRDPYREAGFQEVSARGPGLNRVRRERILDGSDVRTTGMLRCGLQLILTPLS